jgi:hypothetical protein
MAVGMLQSWEGFTKQMYDEISEKMFGHSPMRAEDSPEGLIVHSAGQGDSGWYVYDMWESRRPSSASWTSASCRRWAR